MADLQSPKDRITPVSYTHLDVYKRQGLPLACTTVPAAAARQVADRETTHRAPNGDRQTYYPVQVYVRTPWE